MNENKNKNRLNANLQCWLLDWFIGKLVSYYIMSSQSDAHKYTRTYRLVICGD